MVKKKDTKKSRLFLCRQWFAEKALKKLIKFYKNLKMYVKTN